MKTIYIIFEDKEHDELKKIKGSMSWRKFIIESARAFKREEKRK